MYISIYTYYNMYIYILCVYIYIYSYLFILYMYVCVGDAEFPCFAARFFYHNHWMVGKSHRNLLSMMVIRHGFLVITWDN